MIRGQVNMQTVNVYIYKPVIQLQMVGDFDIRTRNQQLYSHPLKLYKGVNNPIRLLIKNQDQKPVEVSGFTVVVDFWDPAENTVLHTFDAEVVNEEKGICRINFTPSILEDLEARSYYIVIRKQIIEQDSSLSDYVTYIDDNYTIKLPVDLYNM
jgi:hypothetical protein